jgi:hypothetical protein
MNMKQISVFIENKVGRLADITKYLAGHEIDIRALSISDAKDFVVLRLIVNNPNRATALLQEAHYTFSINQVVVVTIDDTPGSLAEVLDILYKNGISVEYMYAFITRQDGKAHIALRVEDTLLANDILRKNEIQLISQEDAL